MFKRIYILEREIEKDYNVNLFSKVRWQDDNYGRKYGIILWKFENNYLVWLKGTY